MNPHSAPVHGSVRRGRAVIALVLVATGLSLMFGLFDGVIRHYERGLAQEVPTCGTGTTTMCISPTSQVEDTGITFTVDVVADNASNLGAYQFTLSFDPSVISLVSVTNGSFLGSTGRDVACLGPTASGDGVSMTCVTTPPAGPPGPDGPAGSGVLTSIEFSGLAPGDSPLTLSDAILADISGNAIPAAVQSGSVTIIQGATATPCPGGVCPTSTPTLTPTPTATPSVGPTTVRIDPPSQTQPQGTTFSVSLLVENVTDLASFQFVLTWDNLTLDFLDVENGAFLGSSGRPVFCPPPIVGENTVRMGCVTNGVSPPGPDGSGVLATFSFRAKSGTPATLLQLFNVELSDPLATDIPKLVQGGTVTIETSTPTPCPGGVCPTTTPTATPTVQPTPYPDACLAGSGADVCVKPPSLDVSAGQGFSLDIVADDVSNLGSYSIILTFDPLLISYSSISNGPFLSSSGREVNCFDPVVGSGSVSYTCVTLGTTPPGPNGAGILATISFTAQSGGSTTLSLQGTSLADIEGSQIPSTPHSGQVTVFPGLVPTPTPTQVTTATPTPTATPATATLVWIDPATQTVAPAETPAIDVRIDNVTDLGSYEWQILYDPAVLNFVGVADAPFLGSTGRSVFCPAPILDTGSVRFGCVTSGSGLLSTVTFSAVAEGTSALSFKFVSLSDPLGNDIPTQSQGGQIVVSTTGLSVIAGAAGSRAAGLREGGMSLSMLTGVLFAGVGMALLASDLLDVSGWRKRKRPGADGAAPESDEPLQADDDT
jgi:hypothetical protein